ncbi:MAG: helicase RepA family protein [Clostridia bacterium]|nr:helicase RepA family protein [Clostridia bacterium]
MNFITKEKTALDTSVGADDEQSIQIASGNIIPDRNEKIKCSEKNFDGAVRKAADKQQKIADPSCLDTISMNELYESTYVRKPPLIDGLLYRGTYLLAGAPKTGKSFLSAQIAYHVSTGKPLWGFNTRKSTVLYLALEDTHERLQERLFRMFDTDGTDNLLFSITANQLDSGLEEQLRSFVAEHPDTGLIIIDTLQKVREVCSDNYSYANDYNVITKLKQLADSLGICILIVHHTRKQQADDKFDMISGTNGLLGAADGAFILTKEKRTGNRATLDVCGRDQPDKRIRAVRNESTLVWDFDSIEAVAETKPLDPAVEAVAEKINAEFPEWSGSPTELVEFLGLNIAPHSLTRKLNVCVNRLKDEHSILYENQRNREGRRISLTFLGNTE